MTIERKAIAAVCMLIMTAAAQATEWFSDSAFVFLRPETSSFWTTATNSTLSLPIDCPKGATKATLTVRGAGFATRTYENIAAGFFDLELPAPVSPQDENVYDLTLTFDDGTVQTARLSVIQGLLPDAEGATRCFAPAEGTGWNAVKKRAVMPIPYGAESFTMSVNGAEPIVVDTGLGGAQGWYALMPPKSGSVSLSFVADGIGYNAILMGVSDGFSFVLR